MRMPRFPAALGLLALASLGVAQSLPDSVRPQGPAKAKTPIEQAIWTLRIEANALIEERTGPVGGEPDFARRFVAEIPLRDLQDALTRPLDKHPFVDAYARWQLTSFDPDLPELDQRQLDLLIRNAPPMVENPRAETAVVQQLKALDAAPSADPQRLAQSRQAAATLEEQSKQIEPFTRPALRYRDWIESKLPKAGPSRLLWLMERCEATIAAGWPTREVKSNLTKAFKAATLDRSLTPAHRTAIAERARRLAGLKRVAVNEITIKPDGAVDISFTTAQVDADDVEKWIELLEGADLK